MSWLPVLTDDQMNDDQKKVFARALTKLNIEGDAPDWLRVLANAPLFLKDVFMNLDKGVFSEGALQAKTRVLLAAVAAAHHGNRDVATFFAERARGLGFTDEQIHEALGIAATSTSFNLYYKFRSLAATDAFEGLNPGLRASLFMRPTMGKAFAELVNLMISTANGCPSCVSGHIQEAVSLDITREQIDEVIRTGAIVASICQFVNSSERYAR
ncbi:hypothetical protein DL240_12905 [Lujinxingia litoralis]|uniref:Carboxymuconolactone decarboxylase-like domain-containing protein n=1 Tax=Lujinxingia litoralis TaxID=2211119 RepID=A0A328C3X5_9DELT|nr:carboxymuconolactone decarboxylase family protein [Lujinxingia litoralis]RAL21744.1 hypothetical protein DL240_12905 [Lujinxingia litoralis]